MPKHAMKGAPDIDAVQFLYGLGRKIWLNRWSAYQVPPADLPTAWMGGLYGVLKVKRPFGKS